MTDTPAAPASLHLEIERQIGTLMREDGLWGKPLALLNRCSLIIKDFEARRSDSAPKCQDVIGCQQGQPCLNATAQCVVVPSEPTLDMINAFFKGAAQGVAEPGAIEPRFYSAYRAMLAAAPEAATPKRSEVSDDPLFRVFFTPGPHSKAEIDAAKEAYCRNLERIHAER